jgi:hypothetical protein
MYNWAGYWINYLMFICTVCWVNRSSIRELHRNLQEQRKV